MNPIPHKIMPNSMTFLGPNLLIATPTNGPKAAPSDLCNAGAIEVNARLHLNSSTIGSKKAPNPCQ